MKFILFFCLLTHSKTFSQQQRIDSLFAAQKDFNGVVLVAENGKPIYQKAFGYREFENQIPLQTSDIFELASVSKTITVYGADAGTNTFPAFPRGDLDGIYRLQIYNVVKHYNDRGAGFGEAVSEAFRSSNEFRLGD